MTSNKYLFRIGFICFAAIVLFLTFNRHSKSGYFNYHSEIWSDKAGYYVYLPALKFGFNPDHFPDGIDKMTGNGFILDHSGKKILTKYTCGVAILQLPFFLLADICAEPLHFEANGFSPVYHRSIDVAAVFYLLTGFFFLGKYLTARVRPGIAVAVLGSLFLATHLYYYSIAETGMSHIYSFAVFCAWIFVAHRTDFLKSPGMMKVILFGMLSGLIVLIRPSNVIFLIAFLFLDIRTNADIRDRLKRIMNPKILLPVIAGALIVFLPQFAYWRYAYGVMINYSYGGEGFNWGDPHLLHVWFAARNGLFPYTPFFIIILCAIIYMIGKRAMTGIFFLILFLVISYVFSCWHDPGFGCAFGARSYVEYLALFSIPVAVMLDDLKSSGRIKFIGLISLFILLAILNIKMIYTYDGCFPGASDWEWNAYFNLVASPPK